MFVVCCAEAVCAQSDALQFANEGAQGQQFVSTNQLLAPRKARQATDRAREDILRGRLDAAQKELSRALDMAPHYAVALAMQGAVNLQTGKIDAAAKAFEDALEQDQTLGAAYVGSAVVLIARDKYKDALIPLERAASLLPGSWYVHIEAGMANLGIGNTEAALKEAEGAERCAGPDPERRSGTSYLRGMVYSVMKDSARANKYLAETIARDPGGFYAALARRRANEFQFAVAAKN